MSLGWWLQHGYNNRWLLVVGTAAALPVAGCQNLSEKYDLAAAQLIGAPTVVSSTSPPSATTAATPLDAVQMMVQDSREKCGRFVDSLFVGTAGTDVILDSLSVASSGLATVFTPVGLIHSFAAASTLFSGTKASLSTNFLNGAPINNIAQAIQSTYGTDMASYSKYLDGLDDAHKQGLDPLAERSTILSYHQECSLAWAQSSIGASLKAGDGENAGLNSQNQTRTNTPVPPHAPTGGNAGVSKPPPATLIGAH